MNLRPSALLFDMDGVLIDSLDSWWHALNDALTMFKHPTITRDEFIHTYWGHDLRSNLRRLHLNPEVATFCNLTYGGNLNYVRIYPETRPTLEQLKRYRKAIITNTPTDCTKQILQMFSIGDYFQTIVTSDDVTHAKPDPEIVFKACELLQVEPSEVMLIGDTTSDVQAGHAAGCTVIGINVDADITIQTLSELLTILE
ncbi:MAG TPA: HAD family hydrolase [Candidatus Thermoplasmatota archaeon]|nr:HAD family hydrolase [Candidatus Thermoplasmatota archaeon]